MAGQSAAQPLVSVIVPAYNAARYITQCLETVAAQRGDFRTEIIVVDDGSLDDTRDKVRAFGGVRLIAQANAGPSAARNRGMAESAGDYIAFLDSDDLWTEGKLAVQMGIARTRPEVAMVFGDCRKFDERGPINQPFFVESGLNADFWGDPVLVQDPYIKLFHTNFIPTGSVVLRKDCLRTCGVFDEGKRYVEDLDMWFRVAFHFPVAYTSYVCQLKRQHADCVSNNAEVMTLAFIQVLEEQRRLHGDLLKSHHIRLKQRYCLEYCALGFRSERTGRMRDARRWYRKGLLAYPSLRPAYYILHTLWSPACSKMP